MIHTPPPPRHLVVCAHPSPGGFGHAVLDTYVRTVQAHGHTTEVRDLYAVGFDPVLRLDEKPGMTTGGHRPTSRRNVIALKPPISSS